MRNFKRIAACLALGVLALSMNAPAMAQAREEAKLLVATKVLDELREQRDQAIPERLLQRAYGVAVIPSVTKVALVVGGRGGKGVLTVRDNRGHFSDPLFITLGGGSFGLQWGAQETDIVLVFTTRRGIEGIAGGTLTLGAGASAAAGPVGRQAEVAAGINAEVYAYSRARGLFAGVALDGTVITMDNKANRNFYGKKGVLPSEIMSGTVTSNSENARRFLAALATSTGESAGAPAAKPAAPAATGTAVPPPHPANGPAGGSAGGSSDVKTFPMEDPTPGKEPH